MLEWSRRYPDDGFVVGLTLRLRGPKPTAAQIVTLVNARLPQLPALAECLDGPVGAEAWHPDSAFDAGRHVHILDQSTDLPRWAQMLANQPVRENQPRWGLWLGDTERDGEFLLAYRVHHAAQDGVATAHTIKRLLDPRAPVPLSGAGDAAAQGASAPAPTGNRLLATADAPLGAMRAIGRTTGASLNEVYLAALAGALRAWLPPTERDQPAPVRVPFSVRLRHERQDRGNRLGYTRMLLPVDEPKPAHRLALVVQRTTAWPRERTRRLLDRMPHHLLWQHIAASLTPGDSLAGATLLSAPRPMAFNGSPVTAGIAMPALPAGHLFSSVLLFLHSGATLCVTAQEQHQHVRDLPHLWQRAVAELAAATCP
ncbi:wax ester/triacylglycerol synthase domain-containing protein [Streptomyces sp. I05A-00742]|uniref:wax ester/triacylglycerol synthase domain-containing protein n=1 Tax=Streptomyces sp. I05A-00742 TaxID=2732853 RepID=UPI00148955A1|nr:wax ester/triacylglycerol synthase domain-containing protein [Streptomyces sp. I05A-00742]